MIAALEAWADAGLGLGADNPIDRTRLASIVATGIGGLNTLLANWDVLKEKGHRRVSPLTIPMLMANSAAAHVGLRIGAQAGVHTPVSACASSNEAIALGLDQLRLGRADIAVVGGTEGVVHPMPMAAFGQMQALSRRNASSKSCISLGRTGDPVSRSRSSRHRPRLFQAATSSGS